MTDAATETFDLYDLRVEVVVPPDGPIFCGAKPGDHFDLRGEMMFLPPGQGMSIYSLAAVLPLLAPLHGLIRGRRYTYAWATLFAIPYLAFAMTELLANPRARWVAALSLLLVFAWFCTMIFYLRASRVRPG